MERTLLFVDYANINANGIENGYTFDYSDFIDYIGEGRFLIDAYIYVPIDPRNEHKKDKEIENLWLAGYLVNKKIGTIAKNTYKCDFDVEITMDIINAINQVKPDIVVLASGDSDFIPLVTDLRKRGIRVEVASFKSSASRGMILKSSGFIDLDIYCQEQENELGEEINYDKQSLIDEYDNNNTENNTKDLYEITKENEKIKQEMEASIKTENSLKNINKPLVEEFDIENTEDELKTSNIQTKKPKDIEADEIELDIKISNYDDPWDWE